jgi:hypothetical protein
MTERECTCLGTCKGSKGLGAGWQCALEAPRPTRQACWAGMHKWGTWTWRAINGGVGHVRTCRRCGIEQTK